MWHLRFLPGPNDMTHQRYSFKWTELPVVGQWLTDTSEPVMGQGHLESETSDGISNTDIIDSCMLPLK